MSEQSHRIKKILLILLIMLVIINLVYLNYRALTIKPIEDKSIENFRDKFSVSVPIEPIDKTLSENTSLIPKDSVAYLVKEATASLTLRIDELEKTLLVKNLPQKATISTNSVKEYYIPLGSGSSTGSDWTDVLGVEAYVTPQNYGKIKEMYFEAAIRIPSQNGMVYARLKNVTDNNGLFESEILRSGDSSGIVSSGKIPVPIITKLYRVQLKSSLGAFAVLDNARIKIFIE